MEGGICDSGFSRIEDAEFLQKVSASYRKCVMQMQNLQRKYPQVLEKARCRCNYTTLVPKRASTTANIKGLQIHQLPKEHLHKRINREYRYIWYQKSKSLITLPISITIHSKVLLFVHLICDNVLRKNIGYEFLRIQRKRLEIVKFWPLCISRWRSLNRNSYPIFFSGTLIQLNELNSKKFTVITETVLQPIGKNVSESIYKR